METVNPIEVFLEGVTPDDMIAAVGTPVGYAERMLFSQARNCLAQFNGLTHKAGTYAKESITELYFLHQADISLVELRSYVYAILLYRQAK